jgi:acyl-CoA dehydrogenase
MMYLVSATLKRYEDQGRVKADLPLVRWAVRDALHRAQEAIEGILSNFPVKSVATLLRWIVFPSGKRLRPPLDSRNRECARIALEPGATRDRLTAGMYLPKGEHATAVLEAAFLAAVAGEPIDKKLREARKQGLDPENALSVLSPDELAQWQKKEALRKQVIKVDDFPPDFGRAELMLDAKAHVAAKAA